MRAKVRKGIVGYLMVPLVIFLDIVIYYLDEVLEHGHSFLYLNTYGQGFSTWWWNFEWFWGFAELGTIKACLIAAWLIYYSPPRAQMRIKPKKSPWIWGLIILITIALIFSTSSPNSPIPYNAGAILFWGWDPAFAARHILEILLFATGFWMLPILPILRRRGVTIRRWNPTTGVLLCVGAILTTHLILVGTWQVNDVLNLENIVLGIGGFLVLAFPAILANLALFMKKLESNPTEHLVRATNGVNWRDFLLWILILGGFLGIVFGIFWSSLNKSIDLGSEWIPFNFWSLIYVALLTTSLVQIAWRKPEISPPFPQDSKKSEVAA